MKTVILTLALAISALFATAQDGITLTVEVNNATSDGGTMNYGLYTSDQFMKAAPEMAASIKIVDGKAIAIFENVQPGEYAVMVFHDKNGNGEMDYENNGMPKEQYGMSNNNMSYGPPQFSDAAINLTEDQKIVVRL